MKNTIKQVAFIADKNGRPVAMAWLPQAMRWVRTAYDQAKIDVATGVARQVQYVRMPWRS